ncbi:hypothetical protein GTA51_07410 [Desulfovibrio aerotolerans]|uniref:Uncharacterized protein n=1 Tax=Solidesulfovibrio aerotolerans TaxID=295255 RepID=A0A7C9IVS4_9BACT|nr:hypothetical protein [Solidesulfovibrio aerotolerans]MYL82962.1 hypothetical protein [Solidesulfovibrio aerotolerans]
MSKRHAAPCALCLLVCLAAATQTLAASKHFHVSCEHFNDYAAKAADLYFKTDVAIEKNILSHLTAVCAIYAEKARALEYMTEVAEHMTAKRDQIYVLERLRALKNTAMVQLPQDVKLLTDLVEGQGNEHLRQLGNLVINELRVFERNTANL